MTINLGYEHMDGWTGKEPSTFTEWMHEDDNHKKEIAAHPMTEVVLPAGKYTITITYPLATPFTATFRTPKKGLTRKQLFTKIAFYYQRIYREEDAAAGDPGNIPGMFNRNTSEGPYGIWGHCLGDLILHTAYVKGDQITTSCDS
jgi:hypothetical protein